MKNKASPSPKTYSRFNLFVRSLIFSFILSVSCILYCIPCLLAAPLPLRLRYGFTAYWIRAMLVVCKRVCHVDYHVEGWSNVKKIKNGILMSKHQSAWETFFFAGYFGPIAMIAKKELLWFPFFGWALALLGPIAINRKNTKSAMQQVIQQGTVFLKDGRWIGVFPEGTRIPSGQIGKYRLGGARLSVESGYPIIPVAHNAGRFWPRRQFIKNPGTVQICFGPPIYPEGKTPEEVLDLTKSWIETKMSEIDK